MYEDGSLVTDFSIAGDEAVGSLDWHQRGALGTIGDFSRGVADSVVPFGFVEYMQGPAADSAAYQAGSGLGLLAGVIIPIPLAPPRTPRRTILVAASA